MDDAIRCLYILLCEPKGTTYFFPPGNHNFMNSNVCKKRYSAKNNSDHIINDWGFTCVNIYRFDSKVQEIGLLPEYLWE